MGTPADEVTVATGVQRETIPEIRPWREVGWIFRDGDAYAIERQGERTRTRSARVSHERDE
jgi:hypothetical protein